MLVVAILVVFVNGGLNLSTAENGQDTPPVASSLSVELAL
jgi:hypothetical protein